MEPKARPITQYIGTPTKNELKTVQKSIAVFGQLISDSFLSYLRKMKTTSLAMNSSTWRIRNIIMYLVISNRMLAIFCSCLDFRWVAALWTREANSPTREFFPTHSTAILPYPSITLLPPMIIGLHLSYIAWVLNVLNVFRVFIDSSFLLVFLFFFIFLSHTLLRALCAMLNLVPTFYSTSTYPSIIMPSAPITLPACISTISPTTKSVLHSSIL